MSNHTLQELNAETDSRFWLQTGYKPGRKLDPSIPADQAMMKTWIDLFTKIKKEDAAGILELTYQTPFVQQSTDTAAAAHDDVIGHLTAATQTDDPVKQKKHVKAAADAQDAVKKATRDGASVQPPTVSPAAVFASALDALNSAGGGASLTAHAAQAVLDANPNHPANAPAAEPSHPDFAKPTEKPHPAATKPPRTVEEHVALTQSQTAPAQAIAVHEKSQWAGLKEAAARGAELLERKAHEALRAIADAAKVTATVVAPTPAPQGGAPNFGSIDQKALDHSRDDGKQSFLAKHGEMLAIGGTIIGGGILAMILTRGGSTPQRRRAPARRPAMAAVTR